jgi:hypothetical protein
MSIDFEDVASDLMDIKEEGMSRIASLVKQQLALEARVSDLEQELTSAKKDLKEVAENQLPAAMAEYGMAKVKMDDGSEIAVSKFYSASIPKTRQEEAFDWLRDNGHESLIKNQVAVSFGRSEDAVAQLLMDRLQAEGFETQQKVWVEPMTLKAFVKEQVEGGSPIPSDLFGIYIGEQAKIKRK